MPGPSKRAFILGAILLGFALALFLVRVIIGWVYAAPERAVVQAKSPEVVFRNDRMKRHDIIVAAAQKTCDHAAHENGHGWLATEEDTIKQTGEYSYSVTCDWWDGDHLQDGKPGAVYYGHGTTHEGFTIDLSAY